MTSFVDVTGGMNPLQSAQALNTAAEATRNQIDWANQQALRNIQSAHTNDDGSLDQFGFIHSAAKAGIAPAAIKSWLDNQNATNAAAVTQSQTNMLLKTLNLDPNALRDQSKIGDHTTTLDGVKLPDNFKYNYDADKGAGAPTSPSTIDADKLPNNTAEMEAQIAARKSGAGAFAPVPQANQASNSASNAAGVFANKPVTGSKAMTSDAEAPKTASDGSMDLGQGEITGNVEAPYSGPTFKTPEPTSESMSYQTQPDRRSILERLADSGSGSPTMPNMSGASENSSIFNYDNVVKTGNLNLKQGVDATLAKLGKTQNQAGVDSILDQAAQGVPVPTPQMKDGHLDVFGYQQEVQAYGAKVLAAKNAAAKALADGNTTALGEILGRDQYAMSKANQEKEFSQVSHPAIKGYLPSPAEKQNLTDASGADKEIIDLMKHVPSPNSAEWGAFKLMMGKSLIKAMNLPVGEGMVDAVGQQMQNGVNIGDIVKTAAEGLASGGLGQAAANAAANGMVQAYQTAMGINSVGGAQLLAKGATDFVRNKWSAYGKGDDFDTYFPAYTGTVTSSPAPKASGAGAFTPRPKAPTPKSKSTGDKHGRPAL